MFIIRSRPNLEETITGIITAIHSGEGLPEELYEKQEKIANAPFRKRMMIAISRVRQTYDENEMFAYAVKETEKAAKKMLLNRARAPTQTGFKVVDEDIDLEAGTRGSAKRRGSFCSRPDTPKDQVSLMGLDAMISKFLGVIGEYSHEDIEEMFNNIDEDGSKFIDREEFSRFLELATTEVDSRSARSLISSMVELTDMELALRNAMHKPNASGVTDLSSLHNTGQRNESVFGGSNTIEYMKELMSDSSGEKPLEDWSIFYCGGSNAIKKDLKGISKRYDIDLAVEKFDW